MYTCLRQLLWLYQLIEQVVADYQRWRSKTSHTSLIASFVWPTIQNFVGGGPSWACSTRHTSCHHKRNSAAMALYDDGWSTPHELPTGLVWEYFNFDSAKRKSECQVEKSYGTKCNASIAGKFPINLTVHFKGNHSVCSL